MPSPTIKKLVVCGGNGFLGSRICRSAVQRGWAVSSISRSGEPQWASITSSPSPPPWAHRVSWERADIFRPETYVSLVRDATHIVHSMGILLEVDYKRVVSGQESPLVALRKMAGADGDVRAARRSANPLERRPGEENGDSGGGGGQRPSVLTYEMMNRDSAILLAKEAAAAPNVKGFAYISAAGGAPVLPARYLNSKREAESTIAMHFANMRSIFVRAPFLYDESRKITLPLAAMITAGAMFNDLTRGVLGSFLGAAGAKPLKADLVAEAVVEGLSDDAVQGPIEVPEIERLANKAWRKSML